MKYKVGDKIVFKNIIFLFDAEILEVYEDMESDLDDEFQEFDYCIKYKNHKGKLEELLIKEKDIIGYAKGTEGYLKEELNKLLDLYSKEDILDTINNLL